MGAIDKKLTQLEEIIHKRAFEQKQRKQKEEQRKSERESMKQLDRLVKTQTVKNIESSDADIPTACRYIFR